MQGYQTRDETVTVSNNDYRIRSLKDRQQFYDHDQAAEDLGISSATWLNSRLRLPDDPDISESLSPNRSFRIL